MDPMIIFKRGGYYLSFKSSNRATICAMNLYIDSRLWQNISSILKEIISLKILWTNLKVVFHHFRNCIKIMHMNNLQHILSPLQCCMFKRSFWSSLVRLFVCSSVCKLPTFSSFPEPSGYFQSNLAQSSFGSNEEKRPFSRRDNTEFSKIHSRNFGDYFLRKHWAGFNLTKTMG